VTDNKQQQVNT